MSALKHTVLLALACSTVFVSGAAAQRATLSADAVQARASVRVATRFDGPVRRPAAPRYDVVVLRVEFQPDTTRFTTGNGTFAGPLYAEGLSPSIDPLPHDADYVEAHLRFLRDYVARVSDGKTQVKTWLLPEVVRVSGKMGDYSPTGLDSGSDAKTARLARLVTEAWTLAAGQSGAVTAALDPERTAFLIVHAGVGRDLELVGTTLDKTPEDLPSLYFDPSALDRLDPGPRARFGGIAVRHGIIVPRTETRQGFNFLDDSSFLAEFSVNGLLAASFFNYLGVPDLFDTTTGESAIGPFGLMDGLGIFAYSGLFPPEPSAWTKQYLGWVRPEEMVAGSTAQLEYAGASSGRQVARASISEAEYFLVENRHRDPEGDGAVLQVWNAGQIFEVRFENGAPGFNSSSVEDFPGGVVVGVDQYDFALPGGLDENGGALLGGMLVWHIDERVIGTHLASNSVNADPHRRGVDLEEADGAQDIGFPTGGFFGPSFHLGSPFDFFYQGNPVATITSTGREVRLYQNRFGADTQPNSSANDGGASFLELKDFSASGAVMSVRLERSSQAGLALASGFSLESVDPDFGRDALIRFLGTNGLLAFSGGSGQLSLFADAQLIGRLDGLLNAEPAVGNATIWAVDRNGFTGLDAGGAPVAGGDFPAPIEATTTPVLSTGGPRGARLFLGAVAGGVPALYTWSGGPVEVVVQPSRVLGLAMVGQDELVMVLADRALLESRDMAWFYPPVVVQGRNRPFFGRDRAGVMGVVSDPAGDRVHVLLPDGRTQTVDFSALNVGSAGLSGTPSLADLDNDGLLDVLISDSDQIWGIARSGAIVNGFPLATRGTVTGAPLAVNEVVDPDRYAVLTMGVDGQVDAYVPGSRRQAAGFPLSVGVAASAAPEFRAGRMAVMSAQGYVMILESDRWSDPRSGPVLGGESNRSFLDIEPQSTTLLDTPRILVPGETYNWPNPVRNGETRFRFLPTEACAITVTILDAAGRQVDELHLDAAAPGVPAEVLWQVEAQSGLYYARVRARTPDGRFEDSLVKVAIIR